MGMASPVIITKIFITKTNTHVISNVFMKFLTTKIWSYTVDVSSICVSQYNIHLLVECQLYLEHNALLLE